jgi:hypothetical protein
VKKIIRYSAPLENFIDMLHVHHLREVLREVDLLVVFALRLQHRNHLVPEVLRIQVVQRAQIHPPPLRNVPVAFLEKGCQEFDEEVFTLGRGGLFGEEAA